jgi:hypothetical protein
MSRSELQESIVWLKDTISKMEASGQYSIRQDGMLIEYNKCKKLLADYQKKLTQM